MDGQLVIHCIGLEGLTITVSGADHSIPMTTDVVRVTTLLGSVDYTIHQFPVTYNTADINGNLTISDGLGKTVYRWRLHAIAQPPRADPQQLGSQHTCNHQREGQSPSMLTPQFDGTAEIPPNQYSNGILNELNNHRNDSSDAGATAKDPVGMLQISIFV